MIQNLLKKRLLDFFRNNINPRAEALHAETIFQGIFNQQCSSFGMSNTYYPVGAAASYSLMYLLTRILKELPIKNIVELGSGQSTILIEELSTEDSVHICYENNPDWFEHLNPKLKRCDYRLRHLAKQEFSGRQFEGYSELEESPFDLLLVDGPNGTDEISRYSCMQLLSENLGREFVMIVDDADRPGETETIRDASMLLKNRSIDFKLNYLHGRTTQAVISTKAFRAASYFF